MIKWKPSNKKAAICFTIDDIHPGKSSDFYEAGGDLEKGGLGLVKWLLDRHPKLKVTLFTTANWREITPFPTRKFLAAIPFLRNYFYLSKRLNKDTMNLERHPEFVRFLNEMKQTEIGFHGLYHIHKGLNVPVEFQNQSEKEFAFILKEMKRIFDNAGLKYINGLCPPGWNAPEKFLNEMVKANFDFIASSRDIRTEISRDAQNNMSGLKGTPLLYPIRIKNDKLTHFPTNFQATSSLDRAKRIIDNNGLLSIKAHIIKSFVGYEALDAVNEVYMNYLDTLFTQLESEYGDDLWWTSMGEMSDYIKQNN